MRMIYVARYANRTYIFPRYGQLTLKQGKYISKSSDTYTRNGRKFKRIVLLHKDRRYVKGTQPISKLRV